MENEMIKLYQAEWCPYCHYVREKLTDLEMDYLTINVPQSQADRNTLFQVSGQRGIPTLVHGDFVISDNDEAIIAYLEKMNMEKKKQNSKPRETVGV